MPRTPLRVSLALLFLATACRPAPALPPAEPTGDASAPPPAAIAEAPVAEPPPPEAAETVPPQIATGPTPKWAVPLSPDPIFVDAPLPPADSRRYAQWRERKRIKVGQSHLSLAYYTPDEQRIVSMSGAEATVRVYSLDGKLEANHPVPGFDKGKWRRGEVHIWPDPQTPAYLVGNEEGLALYDLQSARPLERFTDEDVWSLVWSPDGQYLVANTPELPTQTSLLRFYARDGRGLRLIKEFAHDNRVDGIALSRDNRLALISTYPSNTVDLIDLRTGETRWSIPGPQYVGAVALSPDGRFAAVGGDEVWLLDLADPTSGRARFAKLGNNVDQVAFSPSGDALVSTSYDGHVRVYATDLAGGKLKLLKDLRHSGTANVYAAHFKKDGSELLTSSGDRTLRRWGKR